MTVHRSHEDRLAHSPSYREGIRDGAEDCRIVAACPPGMPLGPQPAPSHGALYRAGYDREWSQAVPHLGCKNCQKKGTERALLGSQTGQLSEPKGSQNRTT